MSLYDFAAQTTYHEHTRIPIYLTGTTNSPSFTTLPTKAHQVFEVEPIRGMKEGYSKCLLVLLPISGTAIQSAIDALTLEALNYIDSQDGAGSWNNNYKSIQDINLSDAYLKIVLSFDSYLNRSSFDCIFNGWGIRRTKVLFDDLKTLLKERSISYTFSIESIIEWLDTGNFEFFMVMTNLTID